MLTGMAAFNQETDRERLEYVPNELLSRLVGLELGSVVFVRDYVQLVFDGPRLTCFVWPMISVGGSVLGIHDAGYRDALCSLIGHSVTATTEATGQGLRVDFTLGSVVLHPSIDEVDGPEIGMLDGFDDHAWMVWQPGEVSFEDLA
jgi:hypothetical protein